MVLICSLFSYNEDRLYLIEVNDRMDLSSAVVLSHKIIASTVANGDRVIDATAGNGFDTVLLAELVGSKGHVYGFDIQQEAIAKTTQLLVEKGLNEQVTLYQRSHSELIEVVETPVKAAMFNLGYLPGGKNRVSTQPETTVEALKQVLKLLLPGGRVTMVVYSRHDAGRESMFLLEFVGELPQQEFNVIKTSYLNQVNQPPYLIIIEKIRENFGVK